MAVFGDLNALFFQQLGLELRRMIYHRQYAGGFYLQSDLPAGGDILPALPARGIVETPSGSIFEDTFGDPPTEVGGFYPRIGEVGNGNPTPRADHSVPG